MKGFKSKIKSAIETIAILTGVLLFIILIIVGLMAELGFRWVF